MNALHLFFLAIGLSMDAFAAAVCKGLAVSSMRPRKALLTGLWFGGFQALMPTLGALLGAAFESSIAALDHWIAFALLALIGLNMLRESGSDVESADDSFAPSSMMLMSIATSIDALAAGIPFPLLHVNLLHAALIIGATTFALSTAGASLGHLLGSRFKRAAERLGGVILILLGTKILFEHLALL